MAESPSGLEPSGPKPTREDWDWGIELEEFCGPTVSVDQEATVTTVANPKRVTI